MKTRFLTSFLVIVMTIHSAQGQDTEANYADFRDTSGEIIPPCEGVDSIAGYTKEQCLFVRYMQLPLITGIIISAIVIGIITWRKRKMNSKST